MNWEQLSSSLLWSYYLPNIFFKTLCRKSNSITRDLKNRFAFLRRPVSKCRSLTSLSSKLSKEIESIFGDRCSEWDTSSKKKEQRREVISTFFYFITLPIVVVYSCLSKLLQTRSKLWELSSWNHKGLFQGWINLSSPTYRESP